MTLILPLEQKYCGAAADCLASYYDSWSEWQISQEMTSSHSINIIALIDHVVAGYINVFFVADEATINTIAVKPEHRKKGIATALIERACIATKEKGASVIYLEVRSKNQAAIMLYEKLQFIRVSTRKNSYSSPIDDAFVYKKPL